MTQRLIILGTGGSVSDVLDIIEAANALSPTWTVAGFLDDRLPAGSSHFGFEVLGRVSETAGFPDHLFINTIGSDQSYLLRPQLLASTGVALEQFATLVHPGALVSSRARLGRGVYASYGVSVGGGAAIGNHVTLHPGCIIGHDTVIEDYSIIAPGAVVSGFCHLDQCCYVGARAVVRQRLTVGEQALVGMGAVVTREVAPATTVVGNPARPLERSRPQSTSNTQAI